MVSPEVRADCRKRITMNNCLWSTLIRNLLGGSEERDVSGKMPRVLTYPSSIDYDRACLLSSFNVVLLILEQYLAC